MYAHRLVMLCQHAQQAEHHTPAPTSCCLVCSDRPAASARLAAQEGGKCTDVLHSSEDDQAGSATSVKGSKPQQQLVIRQGCCMHNYVVTCLNQQSTTSYGIMKSCKVAYKYLLLVFVCQVSLAQLSEARLTRGSPATRWGSGESPPARERRLSGIFAASKSQQYVPPMLSEMLLCITFSWNAQKLVYLKTMLQTAATYQTHVDLLVVTDNADSMKVALRDLDIASFGTVKVWGAKRPARERKKYWLTYEHRPAIQQALQQKQYSTVLYLEDDTHVTWPTLVSWALDTELLQPFNFTRCIFRTEVRHSSGETVLFDWERRENVKSMKTIDLVDLVPNQYRALSQQVEGKECGRFPNGTVWPCSVHRYFVSPTFPFQGMWIANKQQLDYFMQHPLWQKSEDLKIELGRHFYWGYPERSNSINVFLHVPEGYESNCMVPYYPADVVVAQDPLHGLNGLNLPQLSMLAEVEHMRNGYGVHRGLAQGLSSIPLDMAFTRWGCENPKWGPWGC